MILDNGESKTNSDEDTFDDEKKVWLRKINLNILGSNESDTYDSNDTDEFDADDNDTVLLDNDENKTDSDDGSNSDGPYSLNDNTISMKIKEKIKKLLIFGYIRNLMNLKQSINFIFKLILKFYPLNDIKWSRNYDECSSFRIFQIALMSE